MHLVWCDQDGLTTGRLRLCQNGEGILPRFPSAPGQLQEGQSSTIVQMGNGAVDANALLTEFHGSPEVRFHG